MILSISYQPITCCKCNVSFALISKQYDQLINNHGTFFCPNGHSQFFPSESDNERLKRQLADKERQLKWAQDDTQYERRSKIAYKGVVTKIRKRLAQ